MLKKNFFTPEFVQWLPVRLSLFLLNFSLLERLCVKPVTYFSTAETHLQLIVVSMQLSYFFFQMNGTKRCFFSSGNISVFPSLLQQSDDSNSILLPIQHITYNFYHLFFPIPRFVCLRSSLFHVVCSQVRCACIMYIIAVSYAESIKCTWDRHCLYFFTTLLCYYVVHFTYYWQ